MAVNEDFSKHSKSDKPLLYCSHPEWLSVTPASDKHASKHYYRFVVPAVPDNDSKNHLLQNNIHAPIIISLDPEATGFDIDLEIILQKGSSSTIEFHALTQNAMPGTLNIAIHANPNAFCSFHSFWEPRQSPLVCVINANLEQESQLEHHIFSLGGEFLTLTLEATLQARATLSISALLIGHNSHLNYKGSVTHHEQGSKSSQSILSLLRASQFETTGLITVDPTAPESEGTLHIKSLLLDEQSSIICDPLLCINHSEVICSHSAATLFLEPASLFYLMSRGFKEEAAKMMLIEGIIMPYLNTLSRDRKNQIKVLIGSTLEGTKTKHVNLLQERSHE